MPVYEIAGQRYNFDEGLSLSGAIDLLVHDGTLTPDQAALENGVQPQRAETGGLHPFLPPEDNSVSAAQAIGFGRRLSQLGLGQDQGQVGGVFQDQGIATGFGASIPMFAAGPTIPGAAIVGGGLEAVAQGDRFKDDPAGAAIAAGLEGAKQAGFTAGGRVVGELAGRVANGIVTAGRNSIAAVRSGINSFELPSGIRSTLGKLTGNRQIQQAEASLARNPITSRPFAAADKHNEQVMRSKILLWLGKSPDAKLESAMAETVTEAIAKMDEGIPPGARIIIPKPLQGLFNRLNKVTSEAFDLPVGATDDVLQVSGTDMRAIVSDLRSGVRSATASVRLRSREALAALDDVLKNTDSINQDAWLQGSKLYGKWERLSRPGVISRVNPEKVNPTSLFRVIEKGNKVAARSRGNVSSGDDLTDDMLNAARDLEQVGSLTPDSGTPTGLAVPIVAADIVTTGGVGTASAFLASEAAQSPVGQGIATGLSTSAPATSRAGGVIVRQGADTLTND
jgi:hypothetical protein